jgi:hypothetical protein
MEDTNFALKVSPAEALEFTLSRDGPGEKEVASRCIMTLSHPNNSDVHLAFKVKTTQPRRYLVRPNQGIVAPGDTATVNILLVDKDKQMLLQSYDRLGQSALDHSKDKFLVQSCVVNDDFAKNYLAKKRLEDKSSSSSSSSTKGARELGESLTAMWNSLSSSEDTQIYNKKLQVRHLVSESARSARASTTQLSDKTSLENMTPEQMFMEISSLRRKYDELVTFSVNLTAERDILNNTLEQTKRDLNREISNRGKSVSSGGTMDDVKKGGGVSFIFTLFLALVFFLMGVKLTQMNKIDFLMKAPVFGSVLKMEL